MSVFSLFDKTSSAYSFGLGRDAIIETVIDVAGTPIEFCIGIHHPEAKLADIVPLARAISDKMCSAVQDDLSHKNQPVSCRKGCAHCCKHYLVPLSLPEVYYLHESLNRLSQEDRERITQMCIHSAHKILSQKEHLEEDSTQEQISRWYAGLNIPCPFLNDEQACGIYEQRPLACREHMTTQSAAFCDPQHAQDPEAVTMPVSILEVLGQLAAELEHTEIQAIMLPLAFLEMEDVLESSQRKWPAKMMLDMFVNILTKQFCGDPVEAEAVAVG